MPASSSHLEKPPVLEHAEPAMPASSLATSPLRRIAGIAVFIWLFLLLISGFVWGTWSHFFGAPEWLAWQTISGALVTTFLATSLLGFRYSNPLLRGAYALSAAWLGGLNFAFFAAMTCWIAYGVDLLFGAPLSRPWISIFCFGLALVATLYGLLNAARIRTTRVTVKLSNLPKAWEGRTVALVTDLHLGHVSGPVFLRRVISRLRATQPDAILISGDMFDGSTIGLDRLVAPWKNFSAPRGIFYVTGNHDEFSAREIYLRAVAATGIRVLNNEKVVIDGLQIVGVHDSEATDTHELRSILRHSRIDRSSPSILLAHQPAQLAVAEEEGVSLQLSGHTHRGQVWPWNGLVLRIYGRFAYGLHRLRSLQVYTSSGVGTWGPPLRVGTKSEIVIIRLETAQAG